MADFARERDGFAGTLAGTGEAGCISSLFSSPLLSSSPVDVRFLSAS
jgi:hypothetical protein